MKIAIIFSHWTLQKILDFFKDYLDAKEWEIGTAKVERFKKDDIIKDSNKTLILMRESLFNRAIESGLNMRQPKLDFLMCEFVLSGKYLPSYKYSPDLYIRIPSNLPISDIEILIHEKMNVFINFELITDKGYSLFIPLKSRITGEHRNFAIMKFNEDIEMSTRAYIKALMQDSIFYYTGNEIFYLPVFWTKK